MSVSEQIYIRSDLAKQWSDDTIFEHVKQQQGQLFRSKEGRRTLQFELMKKRYFLKYHQGVGWGEIVKNLVQLRLPIVSARNEWRAIEFLHHHQLDTMTIAAYGERGWNPAQITSFLVTDELVDTMSLEHLGEQWRRAPPTFQTKTKLIEKIALIAKKMHENGMNHRDFYLCHFLLDESFEKRNTIDDDTRLFLIDLHRAQIRKVVPERWIIKDIGSLYFSALDVPLTSRDLFRFVAKYTGLPVREILSSESQLWSKIHKRAVKLQNNGKSG